MKKVFMLCLLMAYVPNGNIWAQISNTEILFYVRMNSTAGDTWGIDNPESLVHIYKFSKGHLNEVSDSNESGYQQLKKVSDNLKKNYNYYENGRFSDLMNGSENIHSRRKYNSDFSNQKWHVYSDFWYACPNGWSAHTSFYAFKFDYSE